MVTIENHGRTVWNFTVNETTQSEHYGATLVERYRLVLGDSEDRKLNGQLNTFRFEGDPRDHEPTLEQQRAPAPVVEITADQFHEIFPEGSWNLQTLDTLIEKREVTITGRPRKRTPKMAA